MNGYMVAGKVLKCHTLAPNLKNPFMYSSSKRFKFINWKRIYMKEKNRKKSQE